MTTLFNQKMDAALIENKYISSILDKIDLEKQWRDFDAWINSLHWHAPGQGVVYKMCPKCGADTRSWPKGWTNCTCGEVVYVSDNMVYTEKGYADKVYQFMERNT